MYDRVSYATLPELMGASEYAIVGHITGSHDDVSRPLELDEDDPANPYLMGHEPSEDERGRSVIPVVRYTLEITDSLGSHKAAGEIVEVDMTKGALDSYTMTLDEGATYLLFVADEFDDVVSITAVIEGVFRQDGDTFVNVKNLSTTPAEVETFFN